MRYLSLNERWLAWSFLVIIVRIFCWLPVVGLHFICHPVITDSNPQFCKLMKYFLLDVFAEKEAKLGRVTAYTVYVPMLCVNLKLACTIGWCELILTTGRVQGAALQGLLLKY